MRILLANSGHPATIKGGAEAAVLDLAVALAGRGHEVSLVVHHGGRRLVESTERGIRIFALPYRNLFFGFDGKRRPALARLAFHALDSANPFMARAFGRILDRVRPDVVNTHVLVGLSQLCWREAARRGIPIVHYLHEYGTLCPRGSAFHDDRACRTACTSCGLIALPRWHLSGLVDTLVGVSAYTLRRHLDWGCFPKARQAVLPNIFQDIHFRPRPPREAGAPLRIGFFGRLIRDKGAHLLVEAVKRLTSGRWSLVIAGTGDRDYIAALEAAAPEGVAFLGWSRPDSVFPELDVSVVPSLWPDPQPRVVFESFMYGVPVIGARTGGIPEQIQEGGTGWLFEPNSVDDLARVLQARIDDEQDRNLLPRVFENRLARLNPERVLDAYEAVFAEAIGGRGPGRTAGPDAIDRPAS